MAKHPHIINLSELAWEKINGPQGSSFGGERKRVGMEIGARNSHCSVGFSYFHCRLLQTRPSVFLRFFAAIPWRC
jgi:hypothetical protein